MVWRSSFRTIRFIALLTFSRAMCEVLFNSGSPSQVGLTFCSQPPLFLFCFIAAKNIRPLLLPYNFIRKFCYREREERKGLGEVQ